MSKRVKIWLIVGSIILVCLATALVLVLVLPKPSIKIKLSTPYILDIESSQDGSRKVIFVDDNPLSSGYEFYISENNKDNLNDYHLIKSDKCYLDVSDIFVNASTYYYCAKAIGEGNYESSDVSAVKQFINKFTLDAPKLAADIDKENDVYKISWTKVLEASSYRVFCNNVEINNASITENDNVLVYDFGNYIKTISGTEFLFSVQAVGDLTHLDSVKSNEVSFTKEYTLQAPSIITLSNGIYSWNSVANADSYRVVLNNIVYNVQTNSFDATELMQEVGSYTFKVKAIGHDIYNDSEYSAIKTDERRATLSEVSNITIVQDGDKILVSWDEVENSETFSVYVGNSTKAITEQDVLISDNIVANGVVLSQSQYQPGDYIKIVVNGYGYYNQSAVAVKVI